MDIVHLLPDSVANQIAAGEVIQRPASVVKELVENSIDAAASTITIVVKGAGRQLVQVIDNGKGMSSTDARLSFERHATSKIAAANDLFSLSTMGFRGEALASIAAVAQVELRTRTEADEMGTFIEIAGSTVERQELIQCQIGTTFSIKNLFFNVPARRKFLKSDETELRNIIQELQRIVLAHPDVAFRFYNGDDLVHDLYEETFKQRIVALFDKKNRNIARQLLNVDADTSLVKIHGFVGTPQSAGRNTPQFFFVNGRYMYHPYFRRAVAQAYERMIAPDDTPLFFLNLTVVPSTIDVNIHPTKTEIKFENEREIWSIISIAVREALGKFNITPSIDFNTEGQVDFPSVVGSTPAAITMPDVPFDPNYNPFRTSQPSHTSSASSYNSKSHHTDISKIRNWQQLFDGACQQRMSMPSDESSIDENVIASQAQEGALFNAQSESLLHRGKYICLSMKSGLVVIDVVRASWRIYYDDLMRMIDVNRGVSQKLLFPEIIQLSADDRCLFTEIEFDMRAVGFDFSEAGPTMLNIEGIPAILPDDVELSGIIDLLLHNIKDGGPDVTRTIRQIIARTISHSAAQKRTTTAMSPDGRTQLVGRLFSSTNPNFTPEGQPIITTLTDDDLLSRF